MQSNTSAFDGRSSMGSAMRVKRVISPVSNSASCSSPVTNRTENYDDPPEFHSPSLKSIKRRRSNLGGASRVNIRTPSKIETIGEIENDENAVQSSNILKPITPVAKGLPRALSFRQRLSNESTSSTDSNSSKESRSWQVEDFLLGKPLGRGKFGNVYFAKQRSTACPVALKVLFKAQMQAAKCVNMLRREVEIQSRIQHNNCVHLAG